VLRDRFLRRVGLSLPSDSGGFSTPFFGEESASSEACRNKRREESGLNKDDHLEGFPTVLVILRIRRRKPSFGERPFSLRLQEEGESARSRPIALG